MIFRRTSKMLAYCTLYCLRLKSCFKNDDISSCGSFRFSDQEVSSSFRVSRRAQSLSTQCWNAHKFGFPTSQKPKTPSTQCRSAEKCPLQDYHLLYYCCEYFHHAFPAVYGAFHRVNAAFVLEIWLFWFSFSVGSTMLYPFVLSHCLCTVPWC